MGVDCFKTGFGRYPTPVMFKWFWQTPNREKPYITVHLPNELVWDLYSRTQLVRKKLSGAPCHSASVQCKIRYTDLAIVITYHN